MYALILSLLPAITVLIVALIIKRLNYALLLGLCVAAIIVTKTVSVATITFLMARLWAQLTVPDALYLYGFLLVLGVLITVIEHSGGTAAFSRLLTRRLTDARSTETSIVALSSSLFIDDYLSMLTTGNIMRPIIKNYAIAPEKLAWIIHALSSPLVIIAPLSTWIAMTTSQLEQAGIRCLSCPATTIIDDAYFLFLNTIPFILYSFLTVIILLLIIRLKISYGPMHAKEQAAALLKPEPVTVHANQQVQGSALNLLLPIAILITSFIVGILWDGHFFLLGGHNSFMQTIKHAQNISLILCISSILALIAALILMARSGKQSINLYAYLKQGMLLMYPSVVVVFLASTLGAITRADLKTGDYLAQALSSTVQPWLLPFLVFVIATIISFITGSAWGTIALLTSITVQMTLSLMGLAGPLPIEQIPLLLPVLGALFSGAVCGNHISPLAENTAMAASSAGCNPIDHAITQFWYALPVIIASGTGFAMLGISVGWYHHSLLLAALFSYAIALITLLLGLYALTKIMRHH